MLGSGSFMLRSMDCDAEWKDSSQAWARFGRDEMAKRLIGFRKVGNFSIWVGVSSAQEIGHAEFSPSRVISSSVVSSKKCGKSQGKMPVISTTRWSACLG